MEPCFAAFELDCDAVTFAVIMGAPRLIINIRTSDVQAVNFLIHPEI